MITKELLLLLFEAASIQRWNDHNRPHKGFTELDKQAHKMIYAFLLAKFEETDRGVTIDWRKLLEGGIFEFLHRIMLTDIKPPIFHQLMAEKGELLNQWVLTELEDALKGVKDNFYEKFTAYLFQPEYSALEKDILKASHYLATNWEFKLVYHLNADIYGLEETKNKIEDEIEDHYHLAGVQKLLLGKKTSHFMDLVGQLRFQQRWAQTPRLPETSVLGHMLIVFLLAYFATTEIEPCTQRLVNNCLAGLFHDLPEVLTRDIVSPVKRAVAGLDEVIKEIEKRQVQEKLLPLLPEAWHNQLRYYTEDEFANKIIKAGKVKIVPSGAINALYNQDEYSPLDGELIRVCDHFAAFMEAYLSLIHGVRTQALLEGYQKLYAQYQAKTVADYDFSRWFEYFKLD
ncbi:MAG: HD domain-containing protein [Firmicutes bacterium]|nr:HD domain-containing protein [Bacillota bacterium]